MFRSASARQSDLAMRRLAAHQDYWKTSASNWFDGTPDSVDSRIAKLDNILAFTTDTAARLGATEAGRACVACVPVLEQARRELVAARQSLLNGFSDRQDVSRPAGRRTASAPTAALIDAPPSLQRAIVLGSRDFVADQDTDDRDELIVRARRYAAEETSTLPTPAARQISAAFVGAVGELIAQRPRQRQAAAPVTHIEDFEDSLMY